MNHTVAQPSYRQRLGYHSGLLGGICCFVSIMLISGNMSTSKLIDEHLTNDRLQMLAQVLPTANYDNDPISASQTVTDASFFAEPISVMPASLNGKPNGAALQITEPGWGGPINLIMAVDAKGSITGVRVISHKETPGLADKIELDKSPWITTFNGMSLSNTSASQWAVKKDGGIIDQFTGATITPRAMVKGIHNGLRFYQQWQAAAAASTSTSSAGSTPVSRTTEQ